MTNAIISKIIHPTTTPVIVVSDELEDLFDLFFDDKILLVWYAVGNGVGDGDGD